MQIVRGPYPLVEERFIVITSRSGGEDITVVENELLTAMRMPPPRVFLSLR